MQHANPPLKFTVLACLLFAAAASAQPALPPAAPAAPLMLPQMAPTPDVQASTNGVAQPAKPLGAAARDVVIGKSDASAGTLKELELLQREAFMAELRAKIREANKDVAAVAPSVAPAMQPMPAPAPMLPSALVEPALDVPAQLVNVIIMGQGRGRADVMHEGSIVTVREGDKLGAWVVQSIQPGKVTVERTFEAPAPAAKGKRSAGAAVMVEKTVSAVLKLHQPGSVSLPPPASLPPAAIQTPVVPPLPTKVQSPDSTSIGPAAPLR